MEIETLPALAQRKFSEEDKHTKRMRALCNRDVGGHPVQPRKVSRQRKKCVQRLEGQKRQVLWGVQVIQCSWSIKQKEVLACKRPFVPRGLT